MIAGLRPRIGWPFGLVVLAVVIGGCGGGKSYHPTALPSTATEALIQTALAQSGIHYHAGGSSPETGFDCSGFTQWVFQQHGVTLPRQSDDQYRVGQGVQAGQLRLGDLVFFEIEKKGVSHVGIYIDHGWFIHSPSTGESVRKDNLGQQYWRQHFLGARRILP